MSLLIFYELIIIVRYSAKYKSSGSYICETQEYLLYFLTVII